MRFATTQENPVAGWRGDIEGPSASQFWSVTHNDQGIKMIMLWLTDCIWKEKLSPREFIWENAGKEVDNTWVFSLASMVWSAFFYIAHVKPEIANHLNRLAVISPQWW